MKHDEGAERSRKPDAKNLTCACSTSAERGWLPGKARSAKSFSIGVDADFVEDLPVALRSSLEFGTETQV